MATLTELASRYRWELMLLVGIPVINLMSRWLLIKTLANFNLSLADWFCRPHSYCSPDYVPSFFGLWLPLLLGFLYYFHVRDIRRTILSLLWAYAFVSTAAGTVMSLPNDVIDIEWWFRAPWRWLSEIHTLTHLFILVWFARQASKISFGHALVLIGLTNFLFSFGVVISNLEVALFADRAESWIWVTFHLAVTLFALWVLSRVDVSREKHQPNIERWISSWNIPVVSVPLRRLAVRILPRFDPAMGIGKELLAVLFGLYLLPLVYFQLRSWVFYRFDLGFPIVLEVVSILYTPLLTVIVILLAYAVRVRQPPEGPGTAETKTSPTKPFLCPSYGSQE